MGTASATRLAAWAWARKFKRNYVQATFKRDDWFYLLMDAKTLDPLNGTTTAKWSAVSAA